MRSNTNQAGLAHVALVALIALVIGVAVFVGFRVHDRNTATTDSTTTSQTNSSTNLTQSQKDLESVTAPDPNQLDSDIKNLL